MRLMRGKASNPFRKPPIQALKSQQTDNKASGTPVTDNRSEATDQANGRRLFTQRPHEVLCRARIRPAGRGSKAPH